MLRVVRSSSGGQEMALGSMRAIPQLYKVLLDLLVSELRSSNVFYAAVIVILIQ